MDDPGWGDYVPLSPDDTQAADSGNDTTPLPPQSPSMPATPPPPPATPRTPRQQPAFLANLTGERRRNAFIGGGIVVVAIVVGILVWALSGSSPKPNHHSTTTPTNTTSPGGTTTLSLSAWAAKADGVCTHYAEQVNEASSPTVLASLINAQLNAIRALGDPSTGSTEVHSFLDATAAVANDFNNGDQTDLSADEATSQERATSLGLNVCN